MKNKREQELKQKEFESDLERKLRDEEERREFKKKADKNYHPLELIAIRLFTNLLIGYVLFFIFRWFGRQFFAFTSSSIVDGVFLIFHIVIWGFAIIGVITEKSPWERFIR